MRFGLEHLLALSLVAGSACAQQLSLDRPASAPETNSMLLESEAPISLRYPDALRLSSSEEVIRTGKLQIGGPLVAPFKAKGVLDIPRRFLHMINPFVRHSSEPAIEPVETVDARAWSIMAGWTPGQSAFAWDTHHEPQIRLITLSPGK